MISVRKYFILFSLFLVFITLATSAFGSEESTDAPPENISDIIHSSRMLARPPRPIPNRKRVKFRPVFEPIKHALKQGMGMNRNFAKRVCLPRGYSNAILQVANT